MSPPPEFIASRLELWDELKKKQDELIASKTPEPIQVFASHTFILCIHITSL